MTSNRSLETLPPHPRSVPDETDLFVGALMRGFEQRDRQRRLAAADAQGRVRWGTRPLRASEGLVIADANAMRRRLEPVQGDTIRLNPKLRALIGSLRHALPIADARAGWAYDPNAEPNAPPGLVLQVTLHDPVRLPNSHTNLYFSSTVRPGFPLDQLEPIHLGHDILMVDNLGGNSHGAAYRIVPQIAQANGGR